MKNAARLGRFGRLAPTIRTIRIGRIGRIAFLAASCAASVAMISGCALGTKDEHTRNAQIVDGSIASGYPEAALVDMGGSACSGSVIAPRVVLTAGHCVHGAGSWHITMPFAGGQTANGTKGELYDYFVDSESVDPNKHDVGLVILGTPITLTKYPAVAKTPMADGAKAMNIGRIDNGSFSSTHLFVSKPITMRYGEAYGYPLDYYSTEIIEPGDSGGPVEAAIGDHVIVAVNSGAGGGTQVLARVDLVYPWIDKIVTANGGWGPGGGGGDGGGGSTPGDADGDGVPDTVDLCSKTPKGAPVWTSGEWIGCAAGQWRDGGGVTGTDTDGDGITDNKDRCSKTPAGAAVWTFGEWIGCAAGQFRD